MSNTNVNNEEIDLARSANWYAYEGFSVIPLWINPPGNIAADDKLKGKLPAIKWKPYQEKIAPPEEISEWFAGDDKDNKNLGLVTGAISGVVVLDLDSEEALELAKSKGLPETAIVKTGRGYHYYFAYEDGVRNFQKRSDLPGIDLRAEGGFVVVPPSIHCQTGKRYEWDEDHDIQNIVDFPPLPDWVLAQKEEEKPILSNLEGGVAAGERNDALTRLLGHWVKDFSFDEVVAMALEWNQKCSPPDSEQQVMRTVKSIWDAEHGGLPEDLVGDPWDEPVLFEQGTMHGDSAITADMVPSFVGAYAKEVSRYYQSPEALAVMVGLSMVATCLQKKFVVSPYGDDDYLEPLNLWTVTALKPSERKTPVFNAMMKPLKQWEIDKRDALADRMVRVANEREVLFKRLDNLRKSAANADTDEERNTLLNQINELQATVPDEIIAPRLWIEDITTERLQQMLADHDEKIALLSDEGGIFEVLAGMYSSGKVNVDVLLQAYSGSSVRIERGGRSAYLDSPALTIGLTVQPGIIRELGVGAKRKFRDNGLLARFFYCIPAGNVGARNPRRPHRINSEIKQAYDAGIKRMLDVSPVINADSSTAPRILRVSKDALELWYGFAEEVESMLAEGGELESISDWGGKLAGNVFRVAGNYHVVKGGDSSIEIDAETMQQAIDLCRALIPHAKAAFGEMGNSIHVSNAMHVVNWIRRDGKREFNKRDCQRDNQTMFRTVDLLDPVLRELEERKIIRRAGKVSGLGRKPEAYEVNPVLLAS